MYPTRLNLHNKHLPPTKKEIVHDKLRVGYCPHKFNALSYTINDDMNFGKTDGGFYSKFRIRLTSNNVNGNAYLSISSVEFWGVLEMI